MVEAINAVSALLKLPPQPDRADSPTLNFGDLLKESLGKVNTDIKTAESLSRDFALGRDVELHEVILAGEKASLALQLTIQIRTKILEAYQEIMRMQL